MTVPALPALSRATLDRDAALREDPEALAAAWEQAQVLVVDRGRALVEPDGPALVLVDAATAEGLATGEERVYLGSDGSSPYFAVTGQLPRRLGCRPQDLREVGALLPARDAGLMAHAVGVLNWHATHVRCPRCGEPTEAIRGGSVRRCTADGSDHFPRTDPAVIMLVHDGGDRCVLGHAAAWPPGRYSTLAGFVEPGESLEQAVVREVAEETGLHVTDVDYRSSQPWPFPASLMLGFRARCAPDAEPRAADGELADARWFSREELRAAKEWGRPGGEVQLPGPVSIAWHLIAEWLAED